MESKSSSAFFKSSAVQTCTSKEVCKPHVHLVGLCVKSPGISSLFSRITDQALPNDRKYHIDVKKINSFVATETRQFDPIFSDYYHSNIIIMKYSFLRHAVGHTYICIVSYLEDFNYRRVELLKDKTHEDSVYILVGSMIDLALNKKERRAFEERLKEFAKKHNMLGPVMTSAKDNVGIEELKSQIREAVLLGDNKKSEIERRL